ncbi:MAG: hypothetical protein GX896_03990 [Clostridiales bacterium]|nr:hypothetical protein [Clostridiales bacterium]
MKLKKLFAGFAATALIFTGFTSTLMTASAAVEYKAQLLIQTGSWTYRNAMQDDTYGGTKDASFDGKLVAWRKDEVTNKDVGYDYGAENNITMTDAKITGDGDYSIRLDGDLTTNCEEFNILGVSTNMPKDVETGALADQKIVVSNVKLLIDGTEQKLPGEGAPIIDPDTKDQINVQVVNQYNDALGKEQFKPVNAKSIEIKFTVTGLGGAAEKPSTEKPSTEKPSTEKPTTPSTGLGAMALITVALAGTSVVATKKRK